MAKSIKKKFDKLKRKFFMCWNGIDEVNVTLKKSDFNLSLENFTLSETDKNKLNNIQLAAFEGNITLFNEYINLCQRQYNQANDYINKGKVGFSALHIAVMKKNIDLVDIILKQIKKEDLNKINDESKDGNTLLHLAAYTGDLSMVTLLLKDHKSYLKKANELGDLPLHVAIKSGHNHLILDLCDENLAVHKNKLGYTPLHLAVMKKSEEAFGLLPKPLGFFKEKDNQGKTIIDYARANNLDNILTAIILAHTQSHSVQLSESRSVSLDRSIRYSIRFREAGSQPDMRKSHDGVLGKRDKIKTRPYARTFSEFGPVTSSSQPLLQ